MPLKYTPRPCTIPKLDQITTPNKNIQSYFMRTDASYYVNEEFRMVNYRTDEPIVQMIISNNRLVVETARNSIDLEDLFYLTSLNTSKFKSLEQAIGWLGNKIDIMLAKLGIVPKNSFLSLVFHDLMNRTEILALCNLFINVMSFKGILMTPYSLSQAIGTLSPNCIVVNLYDDYSTVCSVEDFWMLDGVSTAQNDNGGFNLIESEDFVEEFNRIKIFEEKSVFMCEYCDHKESSESKEETHVINSHLKDAECHPGVPEREHAKIHMRVYGRNQGTIYETIANRIAYVFSREKVRRIGSRILVFKHCESEVSEDILKQVVGSYGVQAEVVLHDDSIEEVILDGMVKFADLECARDMWMTDREWNSVGLRILKEKVLFII